MPDQKIQTLHEQDALEQIVETIQQADKGQAPFALVLGSGFSHGLVPTTSELITESLPLWMESLKDDKSFDEHLETLPDKRAELARNFWSVFKTRNEKRGLNLPIDSITGLPEDYSEAYKAAFAPSYIGAVGEPAQARKFQRALMQLNRPRLNAAHFLLASLLGVQPGKSRPSNLFKARAAFCRLILTTNFDPFLQTALQAVNRLYFMSDTPDLGVADDIFDDQTDAIHLVYLHGSIHRRSQAATEDDIRAIKEKNARTLAPVLKRHGVIVLGYSGWDDAIVEALAACDRFDHRLYWCGLEAEPLTKGAFGPRVADILRKPAALYVQCAGAGGFMAHLLSRLVEGLPRLIDNPIGQLRELLDIIDLKELEDIRPQPADGSNAPQLLQTGSAATAVVQAKQLTIERLAEAELMFFAKVSITPPADNGAEQPPPVPLPGGGPPVPEPPPVDSKGVQQVLSSAQLALGLGNYEECLKLCSEALNLQTLDPADKAQLLILRALAHYFSGRGNDAVADWREVIDLPNAPVEQVAQAIYNCGVFWGQNNELDKAIAEYTRVIENLPGAPVEQVAQALYNRGVTLGQKGDTQKELDDYTHLIERLPNAPVKQVAQALNNRGVTASQNNDLETAMADYTHVIEHLPDAPVEQVAKALYNRGVLWGQKGDAERELVDYTQVIEQLAGASSEQVAKALYNRGITWGQKGDMAKAIADYTRIVEQLSGVNVEQMAKALYNRGVTFGQMGDTDKALADYTRVIELPNAPVEQVAQAFYNRGVLWGQADDIDKAIADYTHIIEQLPNAPTDQVAMALTNRGGAWNRKGDVAKALADYTRVIDDLPGGPVLQLAMALNNRGVLRGQMGELEAAIADYTQVIEKFPKAPVEQISQALGARGWAYYQTNDFTRFLADTEAALKADPAMDFVAFNLGLALLAVGRDVEALAAYRHAGEKFAEVIDDLGLPDLEEARKKWLTAERAAPVIELLKSLPRDSPPTPST